ncbi:MAG: hypothetical protein D6704_07520 [Nitrospirae bacterium]|nr:MAG: hypothetical protein D6704_07520 [Nitrospirota bacterium]
MGKIITAKRKEGEIERAHEYIKTYILFPSGLLGLLTMVVGVVALVYQLIIGTYDLFTFAHSSGLLVAGIVLGLGQSAYHKFLLREYPQFFANRMKTAQLRGAQRIKKSGSDVEVTHRGRGFVPVCYLLGISLLIGLSIWSFSEGSLDYMAAFALPWAGFFWGKLFSWRKVIPPVVKSHKR